MQRSPLAVALLVTLAACDSGGGDDIQPIDATVVLDGAPGDGSGSPIDGGGACRLPTTTIACTVGNDAPCTAMCGNAYCYNYNQLGTVCTQPCTPGSTTECPSTWSCNNMGRCRPPN